MGKRVFNRSVEYFKNYKMAEKFILENKGKVEEDYDLGNITMNIVPVEGRVRLEVITYEGSSVCATIVYIGKPTLAVHGIDD